MPPIISRRWQSAVLLFGGIVLLCACTNREFTRTPRTGTEQLLLSHAIRQSVVRLEPPSTLPLRVAVDVVGYIGERQWLQPAFFNGPMIETNTTTSGPPAGTGSNVSAIRPAGADLAMLRAFVEGRLGELGYTVVERREDADLWIRVIALALGTDQGQNFFGLPAIQSSVIPFATPALVLYEAQRQIASVRYLLHVYEARTGKWVKASGWYEGSAYYNQYTLFFFINFHGTDIADLPKLR